MEQWWRRGSPNRSSAELQQHCKKTGNQTLEICYLTFPITNDNQNKIISVATGGGGRAPSCISYFGKVHIYTSTKAIYYLILPIKNIPSPPSQNYPVAPLEMTMRHYAAGLTKAELRSSKRMRRKMAVIKMLLHLKF